MLTISNHKDALRLEAEEV